MWWRKCSQTEPVIQNDNGYFQLCKIAKMHPKLILYQTSNQSEMIAVALIV